MDYLELNKLAKDLVEFTMKDRYYIVDCLGNLAGNKKGYATIRGAMQQADSRFSKVNRDLWRIYNAWDDKKPHQNRVYSVVSGESLHDALVNQGQ